MTRSQMKRAAMMRLLRRLWWRIRWRHIVVGTDIGKGECGAIVTCGFNATGQVYVLDVQLLQTPKDPAT
jgi:hypothetical protein